MNVTGHYWWEVNIGLGYGLAPPLEPMLTKICVAIPDSKVHGANMGPTWVLSAPDGPHVGPMNISIWDMVSLGHNELKIFRLQRFALKEDMNIPFT